MRRDRQVDHHIMVAALGLAGAFMYAASRLVTVVLGDVEVSDRIKRRAWAQFGLALFFGPLAAWTCTPLLIAKAPHASTPAVALAIGLTANVLWPVLVEGVVPAFRKGLGGWLRELAGSLDRDGGN